LPKATTRNDIDIEIADYESGPRKRSGVKRLLGRSPATRIGLFASAALTVAVMVNLLLMQDQRHAAPLFQAKVATVTALPEPTPLPAPRPAELTSAPVVKPAAQLKPARVDAPASDPIAREISRSESAAPKAEKPKPAEARRPDPIAGLMRSVGAAGPAPVAQPATSVEPKPAVIAAQRALMKLGFVIKPDGVFGETTRQAIQRFERDNHMPIRGELTPKIQRELARLSGVQAQ
jgi:hypothetical protein